MEPKVYFFPFLFRRRTKQIGATQEYHGRVPWVLFAIFRQQILMPFLCQILITFLMSFYYVLKFLSYLKELPVSC